MTGRNDSNNASSSERILFSSKNDINSDNEGHKHKKKSRKRERHDLNASAHLMLDETVNSTNHKKSKKSKEHFETNIILEKNIDLKSEDVSDNNISCEVNVETNDDDGSFNVEQRDEEVSEMSDEDKKILLTRLKMLLPCNDTVRFDRRQRAINWSDVKFGNYSAESCMREWKLLMEGVDSSKPKRPLSAFIRYVKDNKEALADRFHVSNVAMKLSQISDLYNALPAQDKKKYEDAYKDELKNYNDLMIKYREGHQCKKSKKKYKGAGSVSAASLYIQKHTNRALEKDSHLCRLDLKRKYRMKWSEQDTDTKLKYIKKAQTLLNCKLTKEEEEIKNKELGVPCKPPLTSYVLFVRKQEAKRKREFEGLDLTQRNKLISDNWKGLSDESKAKYQRKWQKMKDSYSRFLQNHPVLSHQVESVDIKMNKERRSLLPGEPKMPSRTGYMLFCKETMPLLGGPLRSQMSEISRRWRLMTGKEKDSYKERAQRLLNDYHEDLNAFQKVSFSKK